MRTITKGIITAVSSISFVVFLLLLLAYNIYPEYTVGRKIENINLPQLDSIKSIEINDNRNNLTGYNFLLSEKELIEMYSFFNDNSKNWMFYCYPTAPGYEYTIEFNSKNKDNTIFFYTDLDRMLARPGGEDQCLKTKEISLEEMNKLRQLIKRHMLKYNDNLN